MNGGKALIAGLLGALAFATAARAADPPGSWPPPPLVNYDKPKFKELLSGWYLRGDIGYRWNHVSSFDSAVPLTNLEYRNGISGTFGFGYKYQWFRGDVTFDRSSRTWFNGTTATAGVAQPQYSAKVDALSALANGYIDFGTWAGFTPYIGAGAGVTRLKASEYRDRSTSTAPLLQGETTNFSWAWMAGVAFQVHPNWMIDVGYRHLDMGDLPTTASVSANPIRSLHGVTADEVRIGFRLLFD